MKLFLISQTQNVSYDTYDSAVVAAPDEEAARQINPSWGAWGCSFSGWCSSPEHVAVCYLGEAAPETETGVVCASFNAG